MNSPEHRSRRRRAATPTSVVGYCRVSTSKQADEGVSLDGQQERIAGYCASRGLDLADTIVDPGVSAAKRLAERTGGCRVLDMIQRREVGGVVAVKLDRLFRSAIDCLANVEHWDRHGVALHLIDLGGQSIDTSSAMGKMFITMAAGFAELERNLISERTASALKHLRAQNRKTGGALPYGYELADDGATLAPCPTEQKILRRIERLRDDGMAIRRVADQLNREAVVSRGKKWHATTVARLLLRKNAGRSQA